jgi:hypothetical protein
MTSRALRIPGSLILLLIVSSHALADDCDWAKQKLGNYLAACAGLDQCANKAAMSAGAAAACGGDPVVGTADAGEPGPVDAPSPRPARAVPLPPQKADYSGEACSFFTRPSVESENGVTRMNSYANGAYSCYQGKMYRCEKRRWVKLLSCDSYQGHERYKAERQENGQLDQPSTGPQPTPP